MKDSTYDVDARAARAEALDIAANILAARTPTGAMRESLTGHTFELLVLARWIVDGAVAPELTADQDGTTKPEPEALVDGAGSTWHRVAPAEYMFYGGTAVCSRAEIERACGPVRAVWGEDQ